MLQRTPGTFLVLSELRGPAPLNTALGFTMWSWRDPVALAVGSQLASVVCGFFVLLWRPNRPSRWVSSPVRLKRIAYRFALFVACWLLPLSFWLLALSLIDSALQIDASLWALPRIARAIVILGPALLLQYFFFRHLLRHAVAQAAASGEA